MQMTPLIAIHATAAVLAVVTGPVALWARRQGHQHPRVHRAFGLAWVVLMLVTAFTAVFIRDRALPNIDGFTPIHILVPAVLLSLLAAFRMLAVGNIRGHRQVMRSLYIAACLVAGAFTLLPSRYFGQLLFGHWLGLL